MQRKISGVGAEFGARHTVTKLHIKSQWKLCMNRGMNAFLCHQILDYASDPFSWRWLGIRGGSEGQLVSSRQLLSPAHRHAVHAVCDWWPWLVHDIAQRGTVPAWTNTEHCTVLLSLHHSQKGHNVAPYFLNVDIFLRGKRTHTPRDSGLRPSALSVRTRQTCISKTGWIKWRVWARAWKNIARSMPLSWFWFQLVLARHSSESQHNLHYDVFIKISLHSAGLGPSTAASQLYLQLPAVSITPDFIDNYNDYVSYTVISAVKILSQSLRSCMVLALNKIHAQGRVCGGKSCLLALQMLAFIISVKAQCHAVFSCLEFFGWNHLKMTNHWQGIETETVR